MSQFLLKIKNYCTKLTEGLIQSTDILKPALVFKTKEGDLRILKFGETITDSSILKSNSLLSRLDFFRVLAAGYFPLGHPLEIDPQTGRSISTHDMTGHFGAFVKDVYYMKEMKRLAQIILNNVKNEKDFYSIFGFTQIGGLVEFFLENFRYIPPHLRTKLLSELLLAENIDPFSITDTEVIRDYLLARYPDKRILEKKLDDLLNRMENDVYRLGGLERDDSYQFQIATGTNSKRPEAILMRDYKLKKINDRILRYKKNPEGNSQFIYFILADLQLHLIHLSRFSVHDFITEVMRETNIKPEFRQLFKSDSFFDTYTDIRSILSPQWFLEE